MSGAGFLLDARVLIGRLAEPSRLSTTALRRIADPDQDPQICRGVVNLWEIQIKVKLGSCGYGMTLAPRHGCGRPQGWLLAVAGFPYPATPALSPQQAKDGAEKNQIPPHA